MGFENAKFELTHAGAAATSSEGPGGAGTTSSGGPVDDLLAHHQQQLQVLHKLRNDDLELQVGRRVLFIFSLRCEWYLHHESACWR